MEWGINRVELFPWFDKINDDAVLKDQNGAILRGKSRSLRGGCFYNSNAAHRIPARNSANPDNSSDGRGFRIVRSIP